jgi:hypothetical protein
MTHPYKGQLNLNPQPHPNPAHPDGLQERGKFQAETRSNVGGMSKRSSLKK